MRSELRQEIEQGIRELPETYRAVVLLRDVEELTTEERAPILDLMLDVIPDESKFRKIFALLSQYLDPESRLKLVRR